MDWLLSDGSNLLLGRRSRLAAVAKPAPQPAPEAVFPTIGADGAMFMHFRQEDVTPAGATAAHGVPLRMDTVGELRRFRQDGVDYMDCSVGALDAVREPWPADTGFTLWMLHSGRRVRHFAYNGPELFQVGTRSLVFSIEPGLIQVQHQFEIDDWDRAPLWFTREDRTRDVPETIAVHRPHGIVMTQTWRARHNGVDLGIAQGWNVSKHTHTDGPVFNIGGRRDTAGNVVFSGLRWRDVVLIAGRDFTPEEITALEAYAAQRLVA